MLASASIFHRHRPYVCVCVWQRCVVPAGVCNGTSIICSNSNQLPPSPPHFCFFLHSIHSLSFLPQVKLATLKDYNTVPEHHMLSLWVCVPTCFACSLTWCLPSLAAKACQLLRDKNKNRGEQRGDTRYTNMCVCITVCVHPAGCFAMRQGHMVTPGKAGWPVYLPHSGSCQFRFQRSRNAAQALLPKTPHLTALLLLFSLFFPSFLSTFAVSSQGLIFFRFTEQQTNIF